MNQKQRIILAVALLVLIIGIVLVIDVVQRNRFRATAPADLPPGSIPIFIDGVFTASFTPSDLQDLDEVSFVDAEEGKTQQGWLLKDVLEINLGERSLQPASIIVVSSHEKEHSLTWADVLDMDNMVMFDLSGRGTLKLVSKMVGLDIRDLWIQDVDRIEIFTP